MLLVSTAVGVAVVVGAVALFQGTTRRVTYAPVMQSEIQFTSVDDYYSVVNRLGPPAEDKWKASSGELQYRKLAYPKLGINIILMGSDRDHARYIGQLDGEGRVIQSTSGNTEVLLRQLRRF